MGAIPYTEAAQTALAGFCAVGPEHRNCAQTMVMFAAMRLGDPPEICEIARYLGGGIARQGKICGVLTGTALAVGLKDSPRATGASTHSEATAAETQDHLRALFHDFRIEFGGTNCVQLTGYDLSTPEGLAGFRGSDARKKCALMLAWAMERLEALFDSYHEPQKCV